MLRILGVVGGLAGAAGLSQYPEFSQQYTQRLGGQVDALSQVVADFEASALRSGLTRTQAFDQMTGTQFLDDRQADMRRTFTRHVVLTDNLARLRGATPMQRLAMPHRLMDTETLSRTWDDYAPAVPLNAPGVVAAGAGFFGGWTLIAMLLALVGKLVRRRPAKHMLVQADRREPVVMRPATQPNGAPPLVAEK